MYLTIISVITSFFSKHWKYLVMLAMGVAIYFLWQNLSEAKEETRKWKSNYKISTDSLSKTTRSKQLTIEQLYRENTDLEKRFEAEKIKNKQVQYVHLIKYRDTGSTRIQLRDTTIYASDGSDGSFYYGAYNSDCHNAEMWVWKGDSVADYRYNTTFDLAVGGYWDREKVFRIFKWKLFKFGPKVNYVTVMNKCTKQELLKNEKIEINKK